MNLYTTLKSLCLCPSVSGREDNIRALIEKLIAPYCDEISTDALGNLIAIKKGVGKGERVMLCAHMDEIGFLVNFIEDSGMLRVAPVGGIRAVAAANTLAVSERGVLGAIVFEDGVKEYVASKLYIDIGVRSKKEAERKVSIGDFFVCRPELVRLAGTRVAGRPLDDRIGCAVLLSIAEALSDISLSGDVAYVFSVQEEVGCRGSRTAAFGFEPDVSLCFDVTATGDTVGAAPMACKVGGGAAVKIKDASVICAPDIVSDLCRIAKEKKIAYQREVLLYGGTDTSSMQMTGSGSRAGALSIPTRYIHSSTELCDLADAEACASLAVEFIKEKLS